MQKPPQATPKSPPGLSISILFEYADVSLNRPYRWFARTKTHDYGMVVEPIGNTVRAAIVAARAGLDTAGSYIFIAAEIPQSEIVIPVGTVIEPQKLATCSLLVAQTILAGASSTSEIGPAGHMARLIVANMQKLYGSQYELNVGGTGRYFASADADVLPDSAHDGLLFVRSVDGLDGAIVATSIRMVERNGDLSIVASSMAAHLRAESAGDFRVNTSAYSIQISGGIDELAVVAFRERGIVPLDPHPVCGVAAGYGVVPHYPELEQLSLALMAMMVTALDKTPESDQAFRSGQVAHA